MSGHSAESGLPACDCDSMGGRFGAHRPECPWQIAYEAQLTAEKDAACIFCRNNDMAAECWHSPEYEPVARALAAAFQKTAEPTDEQVGWYVDEAEEIAADLRSVLGKDTPLTARQLEFLPTSPSLAALLINERIVATFEGSDDGSGEVFGRLVADFGTRPTPPADGEVQS